MKEVMNNLLKKKGALNVFVFAAGIITVLSKWGCCFYIYHQPKFPDALRDMA